MLKPEREIKYMKKVLSGLLLTSVITGLSGGIIIHAEASEHKLFSFRDIPWYSTKTEAEKILTDSGATIGTAAYKDNILRLDGINFINVTSGKDRVDGGGVVGRYNGLNVAGYDVSETGSCYIYTINEDGTINRTEDDAEFYFGWYEFDSNDYVDGEGIYVDLGEKLTSLYGEGIENTDSDYFDTITWNDIENNQIRLLLGGKSGDSKYVTLGYIVADADERLDEMQAALDSEAIASEAAERESNKENVSGL